MWIRTVIAFHISLHFARRTRTRDHLHVEKNNDSPSYIIALGEYEDDRLCCYDNVRHDFAVSMAICVYACAYDCAYACAHVRM